MLFMHSQNTEKRKCARKLKGNIFQKDIKYFFLLHNLQLFYKATNTWKTCKNFVVISISKIE